MGKDAKKSCEVLLTVPFHDVDPMQMVWHGHYLKYFEIARSALFAQSGLDLFHYFREKNCLFPIIKTATKHVASLGYLDEFTCSATVVEAQYKIVVDFQIRLIRNHQLCAKGRTEQVAVQYPEKEILFEIPEDIREALGF
ncbi:MAG: acyl-CoA thioesterase [Deltaproteobacteria bacterium]|nr:acyl-CoA thioesterase [Deltaproteobacteria bacterium]